MLGKSNLGRVALVITLVSMFGLYGGKSPKDGGKRCSKPKTTDSQEPTSPQAFADRVRRLKEAEKTANRLERKQQLSDAYNASNNSVQAQAGFVVPKKNADAYKAALATHTDRVWRIGVALSFVS